MPRSLLCVHPSSELYGSDRSFASALRAISKLVATPISVRLPEPGQISSILPLSEINIEYGGLFVLRKASIVRDLTLGIFSQISAVMRARRDIRKFDIVYVDTCVVFNFLIAGCLTKGNIIVHVREIPNKSSLLLFRSALIFSRAKIIFNSYATREAFYLPETIPQAVVYNGYEMSSPSEPKAPLAGRALRVLCIGRLNSWKGQGDLISACAELDPSIRAEIEVRIVGGVYREQHHFRERLADQIVELGLSQVVSLEDFHSDPSSLYNWADVVVVPSREPEPFGRVAIEAMAYGCAVVAYGHGGLTEIVNDGETGILVSPCSVDELSAALVSLVRNPKRVRAFGRSGLARFDAHFTEKASQASLVETIRAFSN